MENSCRLSCSYSCPCSHWFSIYTWQSCQVSFLDIKWMDQLKASLQYFISLADFNVTVWINKTHLFRITHKKKNNSQPKWRAKKKLSVFFKYFSIIFAFLQNFFLCQDRLSSDVPPHLGQPCYVALGRALIWGLYITHVLDSGSIVCIIISEYNQTYHTHTSCYYALDLLCVINILVRMLRSWLKG